MHASWRCHHHAWQVLGLQGLTYEDTAAGGGQATQEAAALTFPGEVDRIYTAVPGDIVVRCIGGVVALCWHQFFCCSWRTLGSSIGLC